MKKISGLLLGVQLCFRRFPMALAVNGGRNK